MYFRVLIALLALFPLLSLAEEQEAVAELVRVRATFDVQGHRGCMGLFPENSLAGFEEALRLRVTTVELDLQATKDRVLVVHHDQRLNPKRCAHDDGRKVRKTPIKDLLYDELADIDCGKRPHPKFPAQQSVPGSRIPRLEEVLELAEAADYPVRLNIEIKMQKPKLGIAVDELAELVVGAIKRHGLEDRATVQSFYAPALLAVRELAPEIPRAILVAERRDYDLKLAESETTILSPRFQQLTQEDVRRFQARGVRVIPWTVNKPADIRRLISWGVDGIISDYPDRVIEIYEAHNSGS